MGQWCGVRLEDIVRIAEEEIRERDAHVESLVYSHGVNWIASKMYRLVDTGMVGVLDERFNYFAPTDYLTRLLPKRRPHNARWNQ
ncbi:MAG TPA: hypothetical protein VLA77_03465 [Candidatus Saccharimonadales bacterium]|nr:hypothetical protein [Candidatus Saccharimonadales bacterium]